MTDTECLETYSVILQFVSDNDLGWVASQVKEQVSTGKTVEREIETLRPSDTSLRIEVEEFGRHYRKGPSATFPVTVPYSPREQLALLIDAIECAIVDSAAMETDLFETHLENAILSRIEFHSEDASREPLVLEREKSAIRNQMSSALRDHLETLRKEMVRP